MPPAGGRGAGAVRPMLWGMSSRARVAALCLAVASVLSPVVLPTAAAAPDPALVRVDGGLLRGPGLIEVQPSENGSVVRWSEDLEQPFGAAGGLGWRVVRPLVRAGFRRSLATFARMVEREWEQRERDDGE